jgi:hypothetical protein
MSRLVQCVETHPALRHRANIITALVKDPVICFHLVPRRVLRGGAGLSSLA